MHISIFKVMSVYPTDQYQNPTHRAARLHKLKKDQLQERFMLMTQYSIGHLQTCCIEHFAAEGGMEPMALSVNGSVITHRTALKNTSFSYLGQLSTQNHESTHLTNQSKAPYVEHKHDTFWDIHKRPVDFVYLTVYVATDVCMLWITPIQITISQTSKRLYVNSGFHCKLICHTRLKASELVPCSLLPHWNSMRFFATVSLYD